MIEQLSPALELAQVTIRLTRGSKSFCVQVPVIYEFYCGGYRPNRSLIVLAVLAPQKNTSSRKPLNARPYAFPWEITFEKNSDILPNEGETFAEDDLFEDDPETSAKGQIILSSGESRAAEAEFDTKCLPLLIHRNQEIVKDFVRNVYAALAAKQDGGNAKV